MAPNSETVNPIKKILATLEAQRKITPSRIPLLKSCDDDFFGAHGILPDFDPHRQKRILSKCRTGPRLCHNPRKIFLESILTLAAQIAQFA